jgi:hypothetical protein
MDNNEYLKHLAGKQDQIAGDISEIKEDLKLHIYRTKLAEENIELLRSDLKPVEAHVQKVEGAFKFLGVISLLSSIAAAIVKIFFR